MTTCFSVSLLGNNSLRPFASASILIEQKLFTIFLRLLLISVTSVITIGCSSGNTNNLSPDKAIIPNYNRSPLRTLSILQGYTNQNSTQINVLRKKNAPTTYFVRAIEQENELALKDLAIQTFARNDSDWVVDLIKINGLSLNKAYSLEVRNSLDQLIDVREFKTLNLNKSKIRFIAAACLNAKFNQEQAVIWPEVLSHNPDLIFLLGDNVYASHNKPIIGEINPSIIWDSYVESRQLLAAFRVERLVPTLAIWDNGDYGQTKGNSTFKYKSDTAEIFKSFYPQIADSSYLISGPGIANILKTNYFNFALMDDRFFRSAENDPIDAQTHWGFAQERWLLHHLQSNAKPTWILNGSQIFGAYHQFESYEREQSLNLKQMTRQLATYPQPIIFLTGDRHSSEIMRIDSEKDSLKTFEITTSPLHARVYDNPWNKTPNPRQINGAYGKNNYALIETINSDNNLSADVTIYSSQLEILFKRFISIEYKTKKLDTRNQ